VTFGGYVRYASGTNGVFTDPCAVVAMVCGVVAPSSTPRSHRLTLRSGQGRIALGGRDAITTVDLTPSVVYGVCQALWVVRPALRTNHSAHYHVSSSLTPPARLAPRQP
ncbi:hypothetical protein TELCIR_23487, partial [Teladorsagia circumcincta]